MEMMAGLAHDGRTVIVVTHSVANLDICDRLLVLVPGGKVAYFGPPADGLTHFGQPGWAEVFRAFDAEPDRDWAAEYRGSPYREQYVTADDDGGPRQAAAARPAGCRRRRKPQSRFAQLCTLARRYLAVIASDRGLPGGPAAAADRRSGRSSGSCLAPEGCRRDSNDGAASLLLILVIGAASPAPPTPSGNWSRNDRSTAGNARPGCRPARTCCPSSSSSGVISAVQAIVLVLIGLAGRALPAPGRS